jgi:Mu-like prophage protein Com
VQRSAAVSALRTAQERTECRMLVMESRHEVEAVTLMRCPRCQRMLAKCAVRGMIEIACPRCKTLVRNTFT